MIPPKPDARACKKFEKGFQKMFKTLSRSYVFNRKTFKLNKRYFS